MLRDDIPRRDDKKEDPSKDRLARGHHRIMMIVAWREEEAE